MKRFLSRGGFTLVETLIALMVFTIGLLGTAALVVAVIGTNDFSKRQSQAIVHVQNRLEEARDLGYSNVGTAAGTEVLDPDTLEWSTPGSSSDPYQLYKRVTTVSVDTPASGMKTVTVTVFWNNDARSVSMTNIMAAQ